MVSGHRGRVTILEFPVGLAADVQARIPSSASTREQFFDQLRLRALPPAVSAGFVRRPRLEDRLTAGTAHPVTLISAGPGYGKTLTVASWARKGRSAGALVWLTVDETDNNLPAFWADVLGALAICGALPHHSALRDIVPAAGFGAQEARLVRSGLCGLPRVTTLVLDDFHRITDPGVLESIGQLIEHQPPQLRLVLAARSDPPLRLHRRRVNGDVADIRSAELAFTLAETTELFTANGIQLSDTQQRRVIERTQGWPAGLRLALLSLDPTDIDAGIARFAGSTPLVAEYLIEEVIDRLTATDREFLLTTSVADRISAGLANELTGRTDSQLILERLAMQHALVDGLADRNDWFSVHPLLRDMLRHRLAAERPDAVVDLHVRAAGWFAARGEPIPAIRHASLAQQWDEVGRLTALALPQLFTPNAQALVAALGPAAVRAQVAPTTCTLLAAAIGHFHRHDDESMVRVTDDAMELMDGVAPVCRPAAELVTAVLQVACRRFRNPARIGLAAHRLRDLIDDVPRRQLPAAEQYRVIADSNVGLGQLWSGELAAAEAVLRQVLARSQEVGLGLLELSTRAHLAVLDVIRGRLPRADRATTATREVAIRRGWASEPQALGLYAASAMTYLEWGRLDEAQQQIESGLAVSNSGSDVACRLVLGIAAIGVAVTGGDPIAVRTAASRLASIRAQAGELPPFLAGWCAVATADAHLALGAPQSAIQVIGDASALGGYPGALGRVASAKARLLLHQPAVALEVLDPVVGTVAAYRGPAVEARIVAALAADRMHRDVAAMTKMAEAIDLAQSVGLIRPFQVAGPRAAMLIARHRHIVGRHLDFTAPLAAGHTGPTGAVVNSPACEPLTERELAVLQYLPTMFKAGEIANDLFITVNTVKSHQQSLYRKLGATTRRAAVNRARELKLL